uniref:Uncharacterized protein n=1 Tax=Timema monikensis TaxID=170555 RepID=A0A7R9EI97_9NEOP|nr:unnamed protein product [Timema monikensis]
MAPKGFPEEIVPLGLAPNIKAYLYEQIRTLCRKGTKDLLRPRPVQDRSLRKRQKRKLMIQNLVKGNCLDTLARKFLWDIGLDYLHGTGHGIGSYLNVHEGPMGISWRTYPNDPGLQEGMFLSNEPGYYEDGKFGIRLENIFYIVPATLPFNFKNRGFLTFRTVTLVPIQTKMLVTSLLTEKEVDYLNSYHRECREVVGTKLKELGHQEAWEWLYRETEPIEGCQDATMSKRSPNKQLSGNLQ